MEFDDFPPKLPLWPDTMTAAARQQTDVRNEAFNQAMDQVSANTPWRFSHGSLFNVDNGWYMANLPELAYQKGVLMRLSYKPAALDPLYWDIAGLTVDANASLPFRNQVPFATKGPCHYAYIGQDISSVQTLAKLTLDWTDKWFGLNQARLDINDMFHRLGNLSFAPKDDRTLAICLSILQGDLTTAADLAKAGEANLYADESVGVFFGGNEAARPSIFEKTRHWLVNEQRKRLRLVK